MSSPTEWPDSRLKAQAFLLIGQGVLPLAQWARYFLHSDFQHRTDLRTTAFAVWFPTMIDYLKNEDTFRAILKTCNERSLDLLTLPALQQKLGTSFRAVLGEFGFEEQVVINDRRIQNVHGHLMRYGTENHKIAWFNCEGGKVENKLISSEEYERIMSKFYTKPDFELSLLNKLLNSTAFKNLHQLYESSLSMETHLVRLGKQLGVL